MLSVPLIDQGNGNLPKKHAVFGPMRTDGTDRGMWRKDPIGLRCLGVLVSIEQWACDLQLLARSFQEQTNSFVSAHRLASLL